MIAIDIAVICQMKRLIDVGRIKIIDIEDLPNSLIGEKEFMILSEVKNISLEKEEISLLALL